MCNAQRENKIMQRISPEAAREMLDHARQFGMESSYLAALTLMLAANKPNELLNRGAREKVLAQFLEPVRNDLDLLFPYVQGDEELNTFWGNVEAISAGDEYVDVTELIDGIQHMSEFVADYVPETKEEEAAYARVEKAMNNLAEFAPIIFNVEPVDDKEPQDAHENVKYQRQVEAIMRNFISCDRSLLDENITGVIIQIREVIAAAGYEEHPIEGGFPPPEDVALCPENLQRFLTEYDAEGSASTYISLQHMVSGSGIIGDSSPGKEHLRIAKLTVHANKSGKVEVESDMFADQKIFGKKPKTT
jgi:hypothetical protein